MKINGITMQQTTCNHDPITGETTCKNCGQTIFYIDLGGPGAGGFWTTKDEMRNCHVSATGRKWENKTGGEIAKDIKDALYGGIL